MADKVNLEERVTWYLAFYEGFEDGWWRWFCREDFSHVTMFAQHESNVIQLDPTLSRLNIRVGYNIPADLVARDYAAQKGTTVIKVTTTQQERFFPPICLSCVGVAKYAMGLPVWSAITPYGLFQYLMNYAGAEVVDFTQPPESA